MAGQVKSGREWVTRPEPWEFENLLARPDPTRPDPILPDPTPAIFPKVLDHGPMEYQLIFLDTFFRFTIIMLLKVVLHS